MADSVGMADLRAENVSKVVTGFALQEYVLKNLCTIKKSSAWTETYYEETAADLTAGGTRNVKGVARLAKFPYGEVTWTEQSSRLEKHAIEGVISWEDSATNAIDVVARTLLRIARAVAKSVDGAIYAAMKAATTNTVTISAGYEWDSATISNRDPIQDILNAIKEISIDNYNALGGNGYLVLCPKDYANLLGNANVRNAGQFWTDSVTKNGVVGRLCGLTVVVTNSVTEADEKAFVVVAKEAMTWQEAKSLTTETITDPGIKYTIRSFCVGVTQITNPLAICEISNTQA